MLIFNQLFLNFKLYYSLFFFYSPWKNRHYQLIMVLNKLLSSSFSNTVSKISALNIFFSKPFAKIRPVSSKKVTPVSDISRNPLQRLHLSILLQPIIKPSLCYKFPVKFSRSYQLSSQTNVGFHISNYIVINPSLLKFSGTHI